MTAPGVNPDDLETEALVMLRFLAGRYGVATVTAIVDVLTGAPGAGMIVETLSEFVAGFVSSILFQLGPEGPDLARAELAAAYAAANAQADALEVATFGKKG